MSEITDADIDDFEKKSRTPPKGDQWDGLLDLAKSETIRNLCTAIHAERAKVVELNEAIVRFIDVGLRYQADSKADRAKIEELRMVIHTAIKDFEKTI